MSAPADLLVTPSDDEIIPDLAEYVISGMGIILSPSGWIRFIVSQVFDWDPVTEAAKYLSGDWNAVAQASRAYEALSGCMAAVGDGVVREANGLLDHWEGNAASAAQEYQRSALIPSLDELAGVLHELAGEYSAVAVGMHRTAMLVNDGINWATDCVIFAAASAAATAAASWTIVGGVAGEAATAAAIGQAIKAAGEVANCLTAGQAIIDGATGLIPGYLGALKGIDAIALPGSYDHPAVP